MIRRRVMKQLRKTLLYIVIGSIIGYLYYRFIGCNSGTCAITSSPTNSMIYFGLIGLFMSGSLCPSCRDGACEIKQKDTKNEENK